MHLEPAQAADLPALHALIEGAYRGDSAKTGWSHEADLLGGQRTDLEALEAMIADPAQAILILRDGEDIEACVALADRGDGVTYVGMFTVAPARQATGIGRLLLAAT